jgi:hypothetical protein
MQVLSFLQITTDAFIYWVLISNPEKFLYSSTTYTRQRDQLGELSTMPHASVSGTANSVIHSSAPNFPYLIHHQPPPSLSHTPDLRGSQGKPGEKTANKNSPAEEMQEMRKTPTHPNMTLRKNHHCTCLEPALAIPAPTVAPTKHCVVLTGICT